MQQNEPENERHQGDELSRLKHELTTLQRELAEKQRDLEKLNCLKEEFLAMASHDLRKPISCILTVADMVFDAEHSATPEQQLHIRSIKDASHKVIRQLNDLMDVAQIQSGNLHVEKHPTSLASIIALRTSKHQPAALAKQITLSAEIGPDIPPLNLDSERIDQVVDNLLENAVKSTAVGGLVTVRVQNSGANVSLAVTDTRPGVTSADAEKLFARFPAAGSRAIGGEKAVGLGLAIAKAIIEEHGGTLTVSSEPRCGVTFTVNFPLRGTSNH